MKMPSEILAFKLIRTANISREVKLLILTGLLGCEKITEAVFRGCP